MLKMKALIMLWWREPPTWGAQQRCDYNSSTFSGLFRSPVMFWLYVLVENFVVCFYVVRLGSRRPVPSEPCTGNKSHMRFGKQLLRFKGFGVWSLWESIGLMETWEIPVEAHPLPWWFMVALLWLPVQQTTTRPPSADGVSGASRCYIHIDREREKGWTQTLGFRSCWRSVMLFSAVCAAPPPWLHVTWQAKLRAQESINTLDEQQDVYS